MTERLVQVSIFHFKPLPITCTQGYLCLLEKDNVTVSFLRFFSQNIPVYLKIVIKNTQYVSACKSDVECNSKANLLIGVFVSECCCCLM